MAPMSLRVLAAPSSDTSHVPTLILQSDSKKYMFNAGEGTTRVSAQHRASNTRVEHIFLTRVATETLGGIPGLLMTLADGGRTSINIHAPTNLKYALATTRFYARRDSMCVHAHEIGWQSPQACFQDDHIRVQSVPLVPFSYNDSAMEVDDQSDSDSQDPPSSGAEAEQWFDAVIRDAWKTQASAVSGQSPSRNPRPLPKPHMRLEWARAQVGRQLFCATWSQGTQDAASLMQRRQPLWVFLQGRPLRDFQKGKTWTSSAPYNGRRWTKLLEHNGSALKRVGRTSDLRRTPY